MGYRFVAPRRAGLDLDLATLHRCADAPCSSAVWPAATCAPIPARAGAFSGERSRSFPLRANAPVSALATTSSCPSKEYHALGLAPISNPLHCRENSDHASRQLPCPHTAANDPLTKRPSRRRDGSSARRATRYPACSIVGGIALRAASHRPRAYRPPALRAGSAERPWPSASDYPNPKRPWHRVFRQQPTGARSGHSWHRLPWVRRIFR